MYIQNYAQFFELIEGVIMKNLNFKLFLFPFLLILFTSNAFPENEIGNTCNEAQALLPAGLFSASDSGSSGAGDKDYFSFTVPANGTLKVTIKNASTGSNVNLNYSSLTLGSSPCVTASSGSIVPLGTQIQSISVTTAGTYYIYLEGTKNNTPTTYNISALFTPNAPSSGIDLSITKVSSVDKLLIFDTFFYTINVSNFGDSNASNVTVTDSLPLNMRVDLDATHASPNSTGWTCSGETITTVCTLEGNLTTGTLSSLQLHVKAPPTDGNISNVVDVTSSSNGSTSDIDATPSNNTATAITEVVSDIDTAEHLCYHERTEILNDNYNTNCEKTGNFYYGNGCGAYVTILENNVTDILSSPKIYKMYAPATSRGSCTYSAQGSTFSTSGQCNNISNSNDFGSYQDGYAIILDHNSTSNIEVNISDVSTDNNPRVDGIAMFGDYYVEENIDGTALRFHHTGRIFTCSGISEGGIEITSSADIIDTPIGADGALAGSYNASADTTNNGTNIKYIQTMIASDTREIEGVHLNLDGDATIYEYSGATASIPYSVTPYLTDYTCSANFENIIDPNTNQQLVIDIPEGEYSATGTMLVSDTVRRNARFQIIFIDPNSLSVEGQNCLTSSSTSGNFARIAQCVNSEVQYKTAFGQDAWDRCGTGNGDPCKPSNHGYSCGENDTNCNGYNPLYNNELGCYMCTFNIQPACSTDNFAIRPDKFNANIVETNIPTHYPNLLRSGQDYNTSLTALNTDGAVSTSYNVLNFDDVVDTPTPKKYFNGPAASTWVEDTGGLLHGEAIPTPISPSYIVNGQSRLSNTSGSAEPIVGVTFDDVGRVGIYVADVNWSQVDNDDTPMDCNSSEHTYICGEQNLTFIPHHFGFAELNITNHAGPDMNFTYIADNRGMPSTSPPTRSPMAARIQTRIEARSKQDAITQNFREDFGGNLYYENNISVMQNVKIPTVRNLPAEPDAYLFGFDANESKIDKKLIGFGRTTGAETDDPGTRNIKWNESTYPLEFNFHREINKPANPFDVNGTYYSIGITSDYVDPDDGDTAIIDGSRIGDNNASISPCIAPPVGSCVNDNADNNATFYYGRARPSQYFFDDVTASSVQTPIAIDIYCNLGFTLCRGFGIDIINAQINEVDWWLSLNHTENSTRHDGNITLQTGTITPSGTASISSTISTGPAQVRITSNGIERNVIVTGTSTDRPMIVPVELVHNMLPFTLPYYIATPPYTNSWLIHNEDSLELPSPFYKVRFIGTSGWAGHGDTGHVVDSNVSTKKNRRLGW